MDGHVDAFAFFGGVPLSVLYGNDGCLVSKILPDGMRRPATLFSALQSHYLFGDRYGRPGKGNDQGQVEGIVGYARRPVRGLCQSQRQGHFAVARALRHQRLLAPSGLTPKPKVAQFCTPTGRILLRR